MELTPKIKLNELLKKYPFLLEFLARLTPEFSCLMERIFFPHLCRISAVQSVDPSSTTISSKSRKV